MTSVIISPVLAPKGDADEGSQAWHAQEGWMREARPSNGA
jgi:hypothetical protein